MSYKNALTGVQSQEQIANKLKKEMTPCDKMVLELILKLNLKHGNCTVGNRYIARRLGIAEITVKRTIRKFKYLLFRRVRRFAQGQELVAQTTLQDEWKIKDNLKALFKKCFPSLLKFPHFIKKFAHVAMIVPIVLLSQIEKKLQAEMIYHNTTPVYIKLYSYSNSPQKRKSMLPSDKPDYYKRNSDRKEDRQPEPPRYSRYEPKPVPKRNYEEDMRLVTKFLSSTEEKDRIGQEFLMSLGADTVEKLIRNHMAPSGPLKENG